jgi:hypothetical protein
MRSAFLPLATALSACGIIDGTPATVRHLHKLATVVKAETLHVRPPESEGLLKPYPGAPIDTADYTPFEARYPELKERKPAMLFVIFEMPVDSNRTGFVLRVPAHGSSSAAAFWVYDRKLKAWETPVAVADAYTDSTSSFVEDGWIVDFNDDKRLDVVRRRHGNSTDPETGKNFTTDSLFTALGGPRGFALPVLNLDSRLRLRYEIAGWEAAPDSATADSAAATPPTAPVVVPPL